jgi:hypothetical protein
MLACRFKSSSSGVIHCVFEALRIIQMKSIAGEEAVVYVGSADAERQRGMVRETPVPPAIAKMLVASACLGRRFVPYGPQRTTGVVVRDFVSVSVVFSRARFFRRRVSPFRQRAM